MGSELLIGRITGVHGLAGNLKIWSYAESLDTFAKGLEIRLSGQGETGDQTFVIQKAVARKKGVLLTLDTVSTREAAEALVGKDIFVSKEELPELEADTWYWEDLIGLDVVDAELGPLGSVDRIIPTGGDDILVVLGPEGKKEVLIPMNHHFVDGVDLGCKKIGTTLPQGFILE